MRSPDRLGHESGRITPILVVEGWQGIKELLDLERRRQVSEYYALVFLGERLQLARQRVNPHPVQTLALRLAIMFRFQPEAPRLDGFERTRTLRDV
jgi:hypothetical protein